MNKSTVSILLVEDNPGDALLIQEALREGRVPKKVYTVNDGVQALIFMRQQGEFADAPHPDLILLDLNLPRKSGGAVLSEIKSDRKLCSIPVVVLSTSKDHRDISESYKSHANCFITKPVTFDGLLEVMESLENFWFSTVSLPPVE